MMQYSKNNPQMFRNNHRAIVYTIGLMKFAGAMLCEVLNFYTILQSPNVGDVIKDLLLLESLLKLMISWPPSCSLSVSSMQSPKLTSKRISEMMKKVISKE